MKLLLQIQTNSDVSVVLSTAYAFAPVNAFTHIGNGVLETTIDATHDLSDAQIAVLQASKYSVSFVLPTASPAAPALDSVQGAVNA